MSYIKIKSGKYPRNKVTVQVKHLSKYINNGKNRDRKTEKQTLERGQGKTQPTD